MTDTEIAVRALTEWPEGARPKRVETIANVSSNPRFRNAMWSVRWDDKGNDSCLLNHDHAIALFVAAGIQWLLDGGYAPLLTRVAAGRRVQIGACDDTSDHEGPTLLAALDAAIRSQK